MAEGGADFLSLVDEARGLNSKIFSLPRIELLHALASLGEDGAPYRELKAGLQMEDGILFSNLKALEKMGYVSKTEGRIVRKLDAYRITQEGLSELKRVREWIEKLLKEVDVR